MAGFLEEDNGNKSGMRLMCFMSLFASVFFGGVTLYTLTGEMAQIGVVITLVFLVGAFAPKGLQKIVESKLAQG